MDHDHIDAITDAVTNAVDEWIRAGGGTYEELQAVVEKAIVAALTPHKESK